MLLLPELQFVGVVIDPTPYPSDCSNDRRRLADKPEGAPPVHIAACQRQTLFSQALRNQRRAATEISMAETRTPPNWGASCHY